MRLTMWSDPRDGEVRHLRIGNEVLPKPVRLWVAELAGHGLEPLETVLLEGNRMVCRYVRATLAGLYDGLLVPSERYHGRGPEGFHRGSPVTRIDRDGRVTVYASRGEAAECEGFSKRTIYYRLAGRKGARDGSQWCTSVHLSPRARSNRA